MTDSHLAGTGSRPCASFWGSGCRPGAPSASGGGCPAPRAGHPGSHGSAGPDAPLSPGPSKASPPSGGGGAPTPRRAFSPARHLPDVPSVMPNTKETATPSLPGAFAVSLPGNGIGSAPINSERFPTGQHTPISTRARKRLSSPSFPGRRARPAPAAVTALPGHPGLR